MSGFDNSNSKINEKSSMINVSTVWLILAMVILFSYGDIRRSLHTRRNSLLFVV